MRTSQIRFIQQQGFPGIAFPESFYTALMFQPRIIGGWIVAGIAVHNPWVFVALSGVLWWSTLVPAANPFDAVYNRVIADPNGLARVGVAPAPRRFAQMMAGTFALVIAGAIFTNATITARVLEGVAAAASASVVFRDFCMPAYLYHLVQRARQRSEAVTVRPASQQRTGSAQPRRCA
jgi:hypothetical protein